MGAAVGLREDFGAAELRRLAARAKDGAQARRLLALAAVRDGLNRTEAARLGGMDRQTLRDWVHRFNQHGPDGLIDVTPSGRPAKLSDDQKEVLRQLVEAGPDRHKDGVARWRCVDLKRVVGQRFVRDAALRARLGAAAREEVLRRDFTWAGNARRVVALAEGALDGRRTGPRTCDATA
jgi:transposase